MASVMEVRYMRIVQRSLQWLGSWPPGLLGARSRVSRLRDHRLLFCYWFPLLILQILYIWDNYHKLSFVKMGHNYIICLVSIMNVQRITMPSTKSYQEVIKMFVSEVHLYHQKHYKSEYDIKVYKKIHQLCKFFCYLNHMQVVISIVFFSIAPLIVNYSAGMFNSQRPDNSTFEFTFYFKMPFDYQHNYVGYVIMTLLNTILISEYAHIVTLYDLLLCIIVFHTWGHLRILNHNLRNFPRPEMRLQAGYSSYSESPPWYTPEESEKVSQLLKEYIDHHRLLKRFAKKMSSAYGPMLCVCYSFHQVCGCILLLELENSIQDLASLGEYIEAAMYSFFQLIQLSIIFELIDSTSDKLGDAVYSVPWECMRPRERRTVLMFLRNVQTPIALKAGGLVSVGVRTMVAVLKTTMSYFILLRTFDKK